MVPLGTFGISFLQCLQSFIFKGSTGVIQDPPPKKNNKKTTI